MRRIVLAAQIVILFGFSAWAQQPTPAKPSSGPADFKISGAVTTPLDLTTADLKGMPRRTLRVDNPNSKKTEVYEGVLVEDLLKKGRCAAGGAIARAGHGDVCSGGSGGQLSRAVFSRGI
jgi:DMSO/TMAO reductase YedYZ molybdopterin-dependent catalytic subunit